MLCVLMLLSKREKLVNFYGMPTFFNYQIIEAGDSKRHFC